HVRDDRLGGSLAEPVDPVALDAVGRMGGEHYIRSGELFGMSRPVIGPDDPRSLRHPRRRTGGPRENSS
ncbi:MAG: hypothetical protein OEZ59_06900, partial [Deltaproteobacteria bacterium]|nr:hypothetical protein [Deltaproteobacteria bacterium]